MQLYGLIGLSLKHSFSKIYFTEKFQKENIEYAKYELFSLPYISDFPKMLAANPTLKGLAVTIPYKVEIIPYLTKLSVEAAAIGAVNCIEFANGALIGHNTDAIGFETSLHPLLTERHKAALILGSGGASKAAQFVLNKLGIPFKIVTRSSNDHENELSYAQVTNEVVENFPLIINCTPVGMHPKVAFRPDIPYSALSSHHLLYDMIYNPAETAFLHEGKMRGAQTKNGFEMLYIQADQNWKIWQGQFR